MALSVTSNFAISAGYASNNMRNSQTLMGKSINRISSGLKAVNPADDVVSYIGGTKLKVDSEGYSMLSTGVQDAAARLNMADSVLSDVTNGLLDLKAKAIAYKTLDSTTQSNEQTSLANAAAGTITAIKTAMSSAQYKNSALFEDTGNLSVYFGVGTSDKMDITKADNLKLPSSTLSSLSITSSGAVTTIQGYIDSITAQRANLGGNISALEQISNYLSDVTAASDAAYTAVTEVDMAREMTKYVKNNVQSQAAQAMVSQANQGLAQVLNLLQV